MVHVKAPHISWKKVRQQLPSERRDWQMLAYGAAVILLGVGIVTLINHSRVPLKPESAKVTAPWVPDTVKRWEQPIDTMAKKYNIDPNLIAIVMTLESGGYSKAGSEAGAQGLMQITPLAAQDIASKYLKKPTKNYNLQDPRTNIEFGTAYLAHLRKVFGDYTQGPSWNSTVELVAAGYNGGAGAANRLYKGEGLEDTQTVVYSRDAFNMWRERHAGKSPTFDRWVERGGSRLIDAARAEMQTQQNNK